MPLVYITCFLNNVILEHGSNCKRCKLTVFSSFPSLTFVHMTLTLTKVLLNNIALTLYNALIKISHMKLLEQILFELVKSQTILRLHK